MTEQFTESFSEIEALMGNNRFQRELAQVRARALQEAIATNQQMPDFSFDSKRVWRYCEFIFSEGSLLIREGFTENPRLLDWIRKIAETFEFLARFESANDRKTLLLNSALCYDIAGYHANAQCICRLIESRVSIRKDGIAGDIDTSLALFFEQSLIALIRRQMPRLHEATIAATDYIQQAQTEITQVIADGSKSVSVAINITAHAYFHRSINEFLEYCVSGEIALYEAALKSMQKSHRYFQQCDDVSFSVIVSEIRTIYTLFRGRSTWANLAQYVPNLFESLEWQSYLRSLAIEKSIVEFWNSQLRALQGGLLTANDSFVVQMPTSAGKTFIAELSMLPSLIENKSKCLYIAPYRALVNEVETKLSETLNVIGLRVSNLMGGFEFDAFQNFLIRESDVLVATPEKADLFLRTHAEYFDRVETIIVDEGHIIDEGVPSEEELGSEETLIDYFKKNGTLGRGILLELLITRLKRRLPQSRVIFISAVMPEVNAADFVQWLSNGRTEPLRITPEERPSRQTIASFNWFSKTNGQLEYVSLPVLPDGKHPFVPYFLRPDDYYTGKLTPTGRRQRTFYPSLTNKAQATALLAVKFAQSGPVLVFCAQRAHVRNVIGNIIETLEYMKASERPVHESLVFIEKPSSISYYLAEEWLGPEHHLTRALHYGVALHYGPLPDIIRQAVEDDFRHGRIRILVSTNTLGQGVNLPIKTAIIYSLVRRDDQNREGKVKKRDFWNICGRAGRAGRETEGQVIFPVISSTDKSLLREYIDIRNVERVDSALFKLLKALVENRISHADLISFLDSHVLALLMEEAISNHSEASISNFLVSSLVGVQAINQDLPLANLTAAFRAASNEVHVKVADEALRRVFATTGLSVNSCRVLNEYVGDFIQAFEKNGSADIRTLGLDADLLRTAIEACKNIREMQLADPEHYFGPEDELDLIIAWTSGMPVSTIQMLYWREDKREHFGEYLADRLTYKLPWGVSGFLGSLGIGVKEAIFSG